MKKFLDFSHFRFDLLGGITAGIVALPLALAFGEQSGMGASAGLYGAAFIAFFAALFGGTPTQISGPTAPMTALSVIVIAGLVQNFEGNLDKATPIILTVFLLAGIFQIILGIIKVGTYIKFIPYTVVSGFMSGIGVIILLTQILPALGYDVTKDDRVVEKFKPQAEELLLDRIIKEEAKGNSLSYEDYQKTANRGNEVSEIAILEEAKILAKNDTKSVLGSLKYVPNALKNINFLELILAALTVILIFGFKKITSVIPSTLVALVAVTAGAYFMNLDYVKIQEITTGIPEFKTSIFTEFSFNALFPYIGTAFMLALLGAIDSLLTSVVADNMTKTQHKPNQELIGQGIGNSVSSFFSGLPGAGATIRTVVNIQAGGRTKLSGMIAGVLLFLIVVVLGPIASQIPAAVLAGILITVGIGVMDYKGLRALPKMSKAEKFILLTVLILTVFWQLVGAVGVGLIMASVVFLKRMSDRAVDKMYVKDMAAYGDDDKRWEDEDVFPAEVKSKIMFKHLDGPMFFGVANDFKNLLSDLSPDSHLLVMRMENVPFVDQTGVYALEASIQELHKKEIVVAISGANKSVNRSLKAMKIVPEQIDPSHVFENFKDCTEWLERVIRKEDGWKDELELID